MVFDETNGSQMEQYDLNVVDDEEAPCETLQMMAIGDIRPQDPSEPQASNDTTPPHKTMRKIKRMNKMKIKLMIKKKALIKGEMRMMRIIKIKSTTHKSAPNRIKRSPRE
jgi:hypothetical protein